MRSSAKSFLTAAVLLVSGGLWAQEVYHFDVPDLLARLSFENSLVVQAEGVRHICVAVSRDGDYRIVRSLNSGQMQRLRGKLRDKQLQQLRNLISDSDFRALSGSHGGIIRVAAESFGAEVFRDPGENGTQRLQWLDADGEGPFPAPVAKVVNWLKDFEPTDGKPFEYAEYPDVCPSAGLRLLKPLAAENLRP